jgi:hypothetical protein
MEKLFFRKTHHFNYGLMFLSAFVIQLSSQPTNAGPFGAGVLSTMIISSEAGFTDADEERQGGLQKDRPSSTLSLLPTAKIATSAGVAALCFTAYFLHQKSEYASLYHASQSQSERTDFLEKQRPLSRNAIISGLAGGVLLSAGCGLFIIDRNQKKRKNISLRPIIGSENGILVSLDF